MSDTKHTADELRNEALCVGTPYPTGSALISSMLRAGADAIERVKVLEEALKQGADWFDEYAAMHEAKGATDKAARNKERAEHLRAALEKKP
jgi:hypothetical protein